MNARRIDEISHKSPRMTEVVFAGDFGIDKAD
jgi:hypothetical protein